MVRSLQPGILVNGRCGLPGDFSTPEGHIASSETMWESCMTMNNNWGWHAGDNNWKSPKTVCQLLRQAASGRGNLLLNIGPKPDGSIPQPCIDILNKVGEWLKLNGQSIYDSERFDVDAYTSRGRSDWTHHGFFTARGNNFYLHLHSWPGKTLILTGIQCKVKEISLLASGKKYQFVQNFQKLAINLNEDFHDMSMPVVLHFKTESPPSIYRSGGYRDPNVPHCRYDPLPSEVKH
ncbi:MAG TPA: alpha-L-fucosidase, partial [Anaerohalosphaeraceae bacterium]|nr:alpha-L-fucosidase [Anaerohalosphaeraceae bacterium]